MIYCFDLDNTLCITENDYYHTAQPIQKHIDKVNQLFDDGHTIIIDTARGYHRNDVIKQTIKILTENQLKKWGVKYTVLRVGIKIPANHYIDDRMLSFDKIFK